MVNKIILFIVLGLVSSCSSSDNLEKELIGVWKHKDGAVLILNADSTFSMSNLPANVVELSRGRSSTTEQEGNFLTYKGKWETSTWYGDERFSLRSENGGDNDDAQSDVGFMVLRSGFFQTGPPNRLQIYLDSDGVDVYEFRRDTVKQ